MRTIKNLLIAHTIQTVFIYVSIYLIYSFTVFDLVNPFQWIIDIPLMTNDERLGIIVVWIGYNLVSIINHYIKLTE